MDAFLSARRAIFRTGISLPKTEPGSSEESATDPILMRFLTIGGAVVELRSKRFMTRWHPLRGRPEAVDQAYEVDGLAWECLGCDAHGRDPYSYKGDYLPSERDEARAEANDHANICRAMPKPTA